MTSSTVYSRPQKVSSSIASAIAALRFCDSGFEHHLQRSGQPLKNTVVRIPGPSLMLNFWMLNSLPVASIARPPSVFLKYSRIFAVFKPSAKT